MAEDHSSKSSAMAAAYSSRQKSVVWKYFGVEKNSSGAAERDKHVTCKLCAQKVAHGSGTTNLKNHLRTNHRKKFDQLFENDLLNPPTTMDSFVRSSGVKKLPHNSARTRTYQCCCGVHFERFKASKCCRWGQIFKPHECSRASFYCPT